jgi:hypothetical protein
MSTKCAVDNVGMHRNVVSCYEVGTHRLHLSGREGRWTVTVDETACSSSFATRAEAWEAGVREADRLARFGAR